MKQLAISSAVVIALTAHTSLANDHSCPNERPYPRGSSACDSCRWEDVLAQYERGELSTTRESQVFDHSIRVSVVCDVNRPVDIEDVFEKLDATEREFERFLRPTIRRGDGNDRILEIITGTCDFGENIDDCVMYAVCEEDVAGGGCDVSSGQAFDNTDNDATHTAFVPFLPEGKYWWVEGNRYANLQHEFTHLLDYTYFRIGGYQGTDLDWWGEGLPQFIQWKILNDPVSWGFGNDDAHLLEIFTHRHNTSDYYDGMRVFAYLEERSPRLIEILANDVRRGIYRNADSHLAWHNLLGYIAARYQVFYENYVERKRGVYSNRADLSAEYQLPGLIEGLELDNER